MQKLKIFLEKLTWKNYIEINFSTEDANLKKKVFMIFFFQKGPWYIDFFFFIFMQIRVLAIGEHGNKSEFQIW